MVYNLIHLQLYKHLNSQAYQQNHNLNLECANAGYQWFNTNTFKPGSYGYNGAVTTSDYVVTPSILPNNEIFQMKIQVNNLLPNTTYNNYSLGIFTTGGTQVAKAQKCTWPSTFGYSSAFSFTTNSLGSAESCKCTD